MLLKCKKNKKTHRFSYVYVFLIKKRGERIRLEPGMNGVWKLNSDFHSLNKKQNPLDNIVSFSDEKKEFELPKLFS